MWKRLPEISGYAAEAESDCSRINRPGREGAGAVRRFGVLIGIVAVGLLAVACSKTEGEQAANDGAYQTVSSSEKLANFTLETLEGRKISLRDFEGKKIVVVNFWATWCGPCRSEIPDFNKVYSQYRYRGVEFLGVSLDQSPEKVVPAFVQNIPIDYPVLLGGYKLGYRYNIEALPTTYLIDRDGRIANRFIGMISAGRLRTEINKLLQ